MATHLIQRERETPGETERIEYQTPAVNIYATDDGYVLEADVPGVAKDRVEVHLDQNQLTIVGRREVTSLPTVHYRESVDADFRRVFELNPEIDTDRITARVENGVLSLHLAKREHLKPRRIQVTA